MATKVKSYEEALIRLEEIVEALESGEHTLDNSMNLFKEGVELTKLCNKKLSDYEKSITKLVEQADGYVEEPFDE